MQFLLWFFSVFIKNYVHGCQLLFQLNTHTHTHIRQWSRLKPKNRNINRSKYDQLDCTKMIPRKYANSNGFLFLFCFFLSFLTFFSFGCQISWSISYFQYILIIMIKLNELYFFAVFFFHFKKLFFFYQ